jgi:adenylosuccinate lyase
LTRVGKAGEPILGGIASFAHVLFAAFGFIMKLAPLGAFGAMAFTVGKYGVASIGSLGKLSTDVKLMMQTEVGEVYEPYAHGRGSSSTMPQKRNPISSCYIHAAISVVRQHAAALLDPLAETPEIAKHLSRAELAELCDPTNYLGQSGVMVDRVPNRVRTG